MDVERFLRFYDFLSVVLRAAIFTFQCLTIGGIAFVAIALRSSGQEGQELRRECRSRVLWAAAALVLTQAFSLAANLFVLMASGGFSLREVIGANLVFASSLAMASGLAIMFLCSGGRQEQGLAIGFPAAMLLVSSVMSSHSVARLDSRLLLAVLTGLHQGATGVWIGGLPYLHLVLRRAQTAEVMRAVSQRFSRLALVSVLSLAVAGVWLSTVYVGSWSGWYGTAYGAMAGTKVLLFAFLLTLGAINFFNVRATKPSQTGSLTRVRTFCEAEIGIGLAVLLAAASLTSQPPAADLTVDRLTLAEIKARMTPQWPRFSTPSVKDLPETVHPRESGINSLQSTETGDTAAAVSRYIRYQEDIAWSEYNHHWAGLAVLIMGLLAFLARTNHFPMARNWPLVFIGLAVFLFFRADPETWPLGPRGFWQSWSNPEDLQHRFFVALIVAFAVFEWRVQTGRVKSRMPALVFPSVCALAAAALLTHSHSLGNAKEALLAEMSHLPIAVAGVLAGWSRWLEIRLPAGDRVKPVLSWIWPVCFVLIGAVLLNYREA